MGSTKRVLSHPPQGGIQPKWIPLALGRPHLPSGWPKKSSNFIFTTWNVSNSKSSKFNSGSERRTSSPPACGTAGARKARGEPSGPSDPEARSARRPWAMGAGDRKPMEKVVGGWVGLLFGDGSAFLWFFFSSQVGLMKNRWMSLAWIVGVSKEFGVRPLLNWSYANAVCHEHCVAAFSSPFAGSIGTSFASSLYELIVACAD